MPRSYSHDYRSRCIYHITLRKAAGVPSFGHLCGELPSAGIMRSLHGKIIEKHIRRLPLLNPAIKLLQYCIMPDHVHLLLFVTSPLDMHLGNYIGRLKILIFQECRAVTGSGISIFEDDFYDCILHSGRSLDTIYRYIRSNPHRLAVRKLHPEFFQRVNTLPIGDKTYAAYGNFQLLDNPFKEQVVIHRADTEAKRQADRELWLYTAANGGVLVSPFISPAEKAIRAQAESTGGRFILITDTQMPPRYKPSSRDFALCEQGRLLIITLSSPSSRLSRQTCLAMNTLASLIASLKQ